MIARTWVDVDGGVAQFSDDEAEGSRHELTSEMLEHLLRRAGFRPITPPAEHVGAALPEPTPSPWPIVPYVVRESHNSKEER